MQPLNRIPQRHYHIRIPSAPLNSNLILPSFLFFWTRDSQNWTNSTLWCHMPDISWALLEFYCVLIYSLTSNPIFPSLAPLTSIYSDVWLSLNNIWYCFVCVCLIDNGSHYLSYFSVLPVMFNVIMAADDSTSPWWLCLDPGQEHLCLQGPRSLLRNPSPS